MEDLIIRVLNGRATPEEQQRLREWRRRSPANERTYLELARLWSVTEAASPFSRPHAELPDSEVLIGRAMTEPETQPDLVVEPFVAREQRVQARATDFSRRRTVVWLGRAAVAAALVGVGLVLGALFDDSRAPSNILAESKITTGAGEMATVTLGDGTSIRVGPQSQIRMIQEDAGPVAELQGRAFFAISRDTSRTFRVRTARGEATVLGTRFEVREEDDEFRVLVVDGSVRVQAGGDTVQLNEAEMSRARGNAPLAVDRIEDAYAHLDWMGNALVFQATPLDRALREIERRYDVTVVLMDSTLANLRVTATFAGEPIEEVMLVLCEITGARCSVDGRVVRMGRPTRDAVAPGGST